MVDSANPTHPESVGLPDTTTSRKGDALRRDRWISAETAAQPPSGSRTATWVPVVLVLALGAFLRFFRIGAQPLWLDEATSLRFAHQSLAELWSWSTIVDPGNPPLYYSLLHGWVRFGDGEGELRTLSALIGVLTIPLVYALGRTIRDHRLGIVGALLFAISPFQVWYSQEARGYALLTLGATSAMWGVGLAPSQPGTIDARSRCSRSLARLRGGNDDRAPRAQHRGVPADRSERVDAGLVVEARSGASRVPAHLAAGPARGAALVGQLASGPPSAGGGWRGVRTGSLARPSAAC